ncbi:extensin family protein [Sinorhizobium numidicum]|uniref:Extensin family protein n=1 Tax=Sinorhizobium numidicum TaxID=680248 RepID=A0ABY8CX25_9HYPH|nr:extensin family protein [Sinorhizobium numidicum]WEX76013.1 extensin family protein [Sinorhizobium numidicum]WEX82672.1 extensin family protein [Sinorhizobium numidicum]
MAYVSLLHRPLTALLLSIPLVACTTDVLSPPARVDGSSRVGAIRAAPVIADPEQEVAAAYPSGEPVSTFRGNTGTAPAGIPMQGERKLPMIDSEPPVQPQTASAGAMTIPSEGVNMDAMLGVQPVVGLAEEQRNEIAEGNASQPVVGGIGEDTVRQLVGSAQSAPAEDATPGYDPDLPPLTPERISAEEGKKARYQPQQRALRRAEEPQQVAFLPRARNPLSAPEYTGEMPRSEIACRQSLKKLGVVFRDVPRIYNGPSCGIDYPIELRGLSGNIAVKPAVKLNCEVTEAFAKWVKYELAPSSRYRYWSGVKTIKPLGGYSCRTMNSRRGNPMSEHARGNAIDVGKFVLKNGKEIDVRKKGFFAFRERGLLKAVRTDSCKYFNTVLGPGSDPFHKDHFHFDLRTRKSGYRHCD